MVDDLFKRIPLALRDGEIPYNKKDFEKFIRWLRRASEYIQANQYPGATTVYKIQT